MPRKRTRSRPEQRGIHSRQSTIAAIQLPDGNIPWIAGPPHRPVEPGRGGDGARRRRPARRGRTGVRVAPDGSGRRRVARVLRRRRRQGSDARHQRHRATSRTARGTTTCRPATPRSSIDFWPMVERGDRLRARLPDARPARSRGAATIPHDGALLTGSSSVHASLRCAIAIAERLGHERPDWELSLGALAIADRAPARRLPRQGSLGDGLVLPDPRRRPPRPRRARARRLGLDDVRGRGPRRALRVGPPVGHRGRDVRVRDGARRHRRATTTRASCSRGCSSSAPTTAATGRAELRGRARSTVDGELYPVEQPTWNSAAVVLAANALGGTRSDGRPVPRRGPPAGPHPRGAHRGRRRDRSPSEPRSGRQRAAATLGAAQVSGAARGGCRSSTPA